MTHNECTELMRFNLELIARDYYGSKIRGFAIVDKLCPDVKNEILELIENPEVPSQSVINKDFDLYVILEQKGQKSYLKFDDFDAEEALSF